jgi:hypothetical protein
MHTYRKAKGGGWQAGYYHAGEFTYLGPVCDFEWEAAAIASFLNGGRYCPDEIARIFAVPVDEEDDDSTYPRPEGMDYEPEAARK